VAIFALRRFGRIRISNGLRTFWDKVIVLKLAVGALCKQYCLIPTSGRESCIAWASFKTRTPKCSEALIFLSVPFFTSRERKEHAFCKLSENHKPKNILKPFR
jgi:hypothetical protein